MSIERAIAHAGATKGRDFFRSRATWIAFAFAIVYVALSLSPSYIGGSGPYWQTLAGDAAKGEIGWFYFARDAWRFPLFAIGNYHAPEGGNVLLSDSLPLFALPAKLLYVLAWPAGSEPPIYAGLWVALCFGLQAIAASRLLSALDVRAPLAHTCALALFCYMPMLFLRFGHTTLLGQFLILVALERYVRAKRDGLSERGWLAACALPVVALLVHPYLAAMSGALVLAMIVDQWRDGRLRASAVAVRVGAMAAAALVVMFVGGFFGATESEFGDYGTYSLNLLSPWVPFASTLCGRLLGTDHPTLPGLHQWEGGCYLGAGVLLLCVAALPALRDWRDGWRRHRVLIIALAAMVAFAISNRVAWGSHELLHIPLPARVLSLLSEFRGSGRFVWVPVYVLLAAVVVAVIRRYSSRNATLLLLAAAIVQIADVAPMQSGVRNATASPAASTIDRATWTRLIAAHASVFEFPSFECGSAFGGDAPGGRWRELEIDWIAARLGKPTNSAYLARDTKDCARERDQAASDHGRPGVLYVYRSSEETGAFLLEHGVDVGRCGYLDDVVVCSADTDLSSLR